MWSAWFALLFTFLIFNLLFLAARLTSRIIEEKIVLCYSSERCEPPEVSESSESAVTTTTTAATTTTTLSGISTREMAAAYLTHLENEEAIVTETERVFYRAYLTRIPALYRARPDKKSLPLWLEWLATLYNNPVVFHTGLVLLCAWVLLVAYPVFAFCSTVSPLLLSAAATGAGQSAVDHLQQPVVRLSESEMRRVTIAQTIGLDEIYHCQERWCSAVAPEDHLCFMEDKDLIAVSAPFNRSLLLAPEQWLSKERLAIGPSNAARSRPTAVFTDRNQRHYFVAEDLTQIGARLFSHDALIEQLEQIRRDEALRAQQSGYTCVCPVFLGVRANLTFFYRGDGAASSAEPTDSTTTTPKWLLMHSPTIVRNNSFAALVLSTIRTHFNSNLFPVSQQLQQLFDTRLVDLTHYDSFLVEYGVPAPAEETLALLADASGRLRAMSRRPLLMAETKSFTRVQQQLAGNDAICFIYCDRVNSLILNDTTMH